MTDAAANDGTPEREQNARASGVANDDDAEIERIYRFLTRPGPRFGMAMVTHADRAVADEARASLAERARAAGLRVASVEFQRTDDRHDLVQQLVDSSAAADVLFVVGLERLVTDIAGHTRRTSAIANLNQRRDELPTLLDVRVVFWVTKSGYTSLADVAWDFCRVMLTMAALEGTRAVEGDDARDELAGIYREHFDFVWRSLRHLGVSENDLADLAQDVFVIAARQLAHRGTPPSSVRVWLFGIASMCVRQQDRRRRRDHGLESTHDARGLLLKMLNELDLEQREAFILVEVGGIPPEEVADGLRINAKTLDRRLSVARRKMAAIGERVLADERAVANETPDQDASEPPRRKSE